MSTNDKLKIGSLADSAAQSLITTPRKLAAKTDGAKAPAAASAKSTEDTVNVATSKQIAALDTDSARSDKVAYLKQLLSTPDGIKKYFADRPQTDIATAVLSGLSEDVGILQYLSSEE